MSVLSSRLALPKPRTEMLVLASTMESHSADSAIETRLSSELARRESAASKLEKEVTALFDQFRAPLLRYLSSFGLSPQDTEEVVQEVFVSLFLHLRDGKSRSNIRGWIFRVAHNLGLKRREAIHRAQKTVAVPDESSSKLQLDSAPNPEEHVSLLQGRQRLLAVVNALPEQDRRCLYLRAEGLRYREIARILNISLGGVALSLARSLSRLAKIDGR